MRIALVEPSQGLWYAGKYCRQSQLEPLGICYLAAVTSKEGHTVQIFHQKDISEDKFINKIFNFNPDVVGFSTHTYNFQIACNIAQRLKDKSNSISTVFGGHHISGFPEAVINKPIDFGVLGEGELTFVDLIKHLEAGDSCQDIPGIVIGNGNYYKSHPRNRIKELDQLPWPKRDLELLKDNKVESVIYPTPSQQKSVTQILTARACSNNCPFCSSASLWGRKVVCRKPINIVDEIEHVHKNYETNLIYFADLSFNINRLNLLALCEILKQRKLDLHWTASVNLNLIDEETVKSMSGAGCSRLAFGIEALSVITLKKIKAIQNKMDFNDIKKKLELVHGYGIFVRGLFMMGYPWETMKQIDEFATQLVDLPIDHLRITFITPFPGTLLYEKYLQNGLNNNIDFSRFTTEEPVLKVPGITFEELLNIRKEIFKEFYCSIEYEKRCKKQIKKFPTSKTAYEEFFSILEKKGIIN